MHTLNTLRRYSIPAVMSDAGGFWGAILTVVTVILILAGLTAKRASSDKSTAEFCSECCCCAMPHAPAGGPGFSAPSARKGVVAQQHNAAPEASAAATATAVRPVEEAKARP